LSTSTAQRPVAAPAGPRQQPGWGPLLVMLTGTFMTFLDGNNASVKAILAGQHLSRLPGTSPRAGAQLGIGRGERCPPMVRIGLPDCLG
jgi:hypothetical protein